MRALVIGDDTRSFLAIVRSLGRQGWVVDAAPFDFSSPALSSRYLRRVHRVDAYSISAERWVDRLRSLVAQEHYDLIIPCDDRALIPLAHHAQAFATRLAVPNAEAVAIFFDKVETRGLAASLGVSVARGKALDDGDTADGLVRDFGLPLALKPRSSYVLGQAGARSTVRIVRTAATLQTFLGDLRRPTGWLVESFFHGEGCGISVLADRGEVVMAFQHRRLAESSESGGSSVRVGEPVDPALMKHVEAMARATGLHGVAMFEFRRDRDSRHAILLEVNCRFWGSLPLAVASGADFPAAAARLHVQDRSSPRPGAYRPGIVRRDLGGEYNRIVTAASGRGSPAAKLIAAAAGFARLAPALISGRGFDSHAPDDPAPFRRDRGQLARHMTMAFAKRLTPPALRRVRGRAALRRLRRHVGGGNGELVILCHGNICRSPFAEHRLREKARLAGLRLDILSAGTIETEGRRSPDEAVVAARRFGVDLSGHRSRVVDGKTARRAAAVIVFDDRNVDELRRLGLDDGVDLLRLPDLVGRRGIEDPYGRGPAGFDRVYADIDRALDRLVLALAPGGETR